MAAITCIRMGQGQCKLRMRSTREILFRLSQEIKNVGFYIREPSWTGQIASVSLSGLPKPIAVASKLRDSAFAVNLIATADEIIAHRFPLLGTVIETGPDIEWRRDYVNNKVSDLSFFRRIPYLDAKVVGDHKVIWELNRHQHLVLLAEAFLFSKSDIYLREIERQVTMWCEQNPFARGINWASALEVAFRAHSWLWVLHLLGPALDQATAERMISGLYQHGVYLHNNLSYYFAPNTHLLGEAVALHALGRVLPCHAKSDAWAALGASVTEAQMQTQVMNDGSHFEQSTYYHVYAMDMFLFHSTLTKTSEEFQRKLWKMAEYLDALLGHDRRLPFFGDDDGGRWFHPYGARDQFGRATLATFNALTGTATWHSESTDFYPQACWWTDCSASSASRGSQGAKFFRDSGLCVLQQDTNKIIVDAGPFGRGSGGHSHADTLSLTITMGEAEVLIDAGTFTYVGSREARDQFRGTAAHNTVRIDGLDQADAVNPFRWANPPAVRIVDATTSELEDVIEGECRYRGFVHKRKIRLIKPFVLFITDEVLGPPGEHLVECFWHLGTEVAQNRFVFSHEANRIRGCRSRCFGEKEEVLTLRMQQNTELPCRFATAIVLDNAVTAEILASDGSLTLQLRDYSETRSFSF